MDDHSTSGKSEVTNLSRKSSEIREKGIAGSYEDKEYFREEENSILKLLSLFHSLVKLCLVFNLKIFVLSLKFIIVCYTVRFILNLDCLFFHLLVFFFDFD
jgi:hypothetical protein